MSPTHRHESAPPESFKTSEVEATAPSAEVSNVTPRALIDAMVKSDLKVVMVPAAEPVALSNGFTVVNLRETVCINGRPVGPGVGCVVPTDAFAVWGNSLAKE